MFLSFFEEKPFYHELDFKSPFLEPYLYSIINHKNRTYSNENSDNYDLTSIHNLQSIIVSGPRSSGKSTQIYAFIASLVNSRSIYNLKINIEGFRYKYSPFHIQFSIKNFKNNDIIDDNPNIKFIRNIISTPNMGFNIPKLLYIQDFDKSSMEIQKFFLRIIEKSATNVRFILEINDLKNLNEAIISRFLVLRCNTPSLEQIQLSLNNIYDKYIINDYLNMIENRDKIIDTLKEEKENVIEKMILNSHLHNFTYQPSCDSKSPEGCSASRPYQIYYNLKDVYGNMAIYISSFQNPFMYKHIYLPMYIKKCIKLKNIILNTNQDIFFENMNYIRDLLLELYVNNIDSSIILKYLHLTFVQYFNNPEITMDLTEKLTKVERNMKAANKDVIFIELYIVYILKYLLFYKNNTQEIEINKKDNEIKEVTTSLADLWSAGGSRKSTEIEDIKKVEEVPEVKKRGRKKKE